MFAYVDNAATTPVGKAALESMTECLQQVYGNPSSIHSQGQEAAQLMGKARETVGNCLGARPEEIYFTSGGTEADNWAIKTAALLGARKNKKHLISTAFEHHAVLHSLRLWEKQGYSLTLLNVHGDGLVRPEELASAIREDTALVSVMYANNEIGTVQPVAEIGTICRERGVLFHTDAVQAVGHLPIDAQEQKIDLLSLSAHKFHGPKGVGALYCRKGIPLDIFMEGGAQERGKRAGTENIPGIAGMAAALKEACANMTEDNKKVSALRDKLIQAMTRIPRSRLNGHPTRRLPGIANFCFSGIEGEGLLLHLDQHGICASSGSACTSGSLDPSHVLLAIGLPHEEAHGSLRISLSALNTEAEVEHIIAMLPGLIEKLRSMSPVWQKIRQNEGS
ncbi:MAG: cysteine desulfurase NifS [Desulfovibrionaceae bacterium]|nr:cysteine desulfurase NifS [Desulfovibrionaceae bacterium]